MKKKRKEVYREIQGQGLKIEISFQARNSKRINNIIAFKMI